MLLLHQTRSLYKTLPLNEALKLSRPRISFRNFATVTRGTAVQETDVRPFAVIKVGGEVLEQPHVESLIEALKILQAHGKACCVVHGGGPQLNDELKHQQVEANYIKGHRVTDEKILAVAKDTFSRLNARLVQQLQENGVEAQGFESGVFGAKMADQSSGLGYVGEVEEVFVDDVQECLNKEKIPVLASLGFNLKTIEDPYSKEIKLKDCLNINADVAAREFALALEAKKVVFTSSKGGWTEDGAIVPNINLYNDYERLASMDYTGRQGTLLKLNEIKALLENLPGDSSVTICASDKIIESLLPTSVEPDGPGTTFILGGEDQYKDVVKVGLIGARGYVGKEFCRLLNSHPHLKLVVASSRQHENQNVLKTFELSKSSTNSISSDLKFSNVGADAIVKTTKDFNVDLWVFALPNGLSPEFSEQIDIFNETNEKAPVKIIDLSADNRFQDESIWAYGLPERKGQREVLKTAVRISNPGCYATGMQTALMPLMLPLSLDDVRIKEGSVPVCFGVSGFSGAGTGKSRNNDENFLNNNLVAYKLTGHIHEKECSRFLAQSINFVPHVGQWFQGIHLTINCYLNPKENGEYPTRQEVIKSFKEYYEGETLIKINDVSKEFNTVSSISKKHYVELGGFEVDQESGRLVVISLIDNLLKGAATQAIQNINIAFEFEEYAGIPY